MSVAPNPNPKPIAATTREARRKGARGERGKRGSGKPGLPPNPTLQNVIRDVIRDENEQIRTTNHNFARGFEKRKTIEITRREIEWRCANHYQEHRR